MKNHNLTLTSAFRSRSGGTRLQNFMGNLPLILAVIVLGLTVYGSNPRVQMRMATRALLAHEQTLRAESGTFQAISAEEVPDFPRDVELTLSISEDGQKLAAHLKHVRSDRICMIAGPLPPLDSLQSTSEMDDFWIGCGRGKEQRPASALGLF